MWFLLFSTGAILLGTAGLPAARRLPVAPPPEALVACYFLLATLLRLLVRNARLAAFERKAQREARRKGEGQGTSSLGELGMGVGRGALQAVGGDVLGAGLSLAAALLKGAASSLSAPVPAARERRRAARWERLKAAASVVGVGLVCVGVAWEPLVHRRLRRLAAVAVTEAASPAEATRLTPPARPAERASAAAVEGTRPAAKASAPAAEAASPAVPLPPQDAPQELDPSTLQRPP
jgi:hypothetical protein